MKGIYVPIAVCGERFVDRWLRYSLPTLLSPGNLPALAKHYPVKVLLCSTQEDLPRILQSPLIKAVREVMGVRAIPVARNFAELVAKVQGDKYRLMTMCHNYGFELGWQDNYGVISGMADMLYPQDGFASLLPYIASGKRAVVIGGLEIEQEQLDGLLDEYKVARDQVALTIPPRTLVRIAMRAPHPMMQSMTWTLDRFTLHPSTLFWPLGGHGMLLRAFHLLPLFLYPDRQAQIRTSVDGDFLASALSNLDDCAFIDDSDQFCFAGVTDRSKSEFMPAGPHRADPRAVAQWMMTNTLPFHRELNIQRKFWLHDGIDREAWRHVEAESDQAIADVLRCYEEATATAASINR